MAATRSGGNSAARVPMSSLKTLYFKDGASTMARRGKKMPQLKCVGNSRHLCDTYGPAVILCKSAGDGAWRCEADLHPSVRLGAVEVSCEGWENSEDEYVLRGSCMLEYNILPAYAEGTGERSSRGEHYPRIRSIRSIRSLLTQLSNLHEHVGLSSSLKDTVFGNLFFIVFFGVVGYIVYSFFRSLGGGNNTQGQRRGGNRGGWGGWGAGGGGGGGGGDAPPPPYQPYPKTNPSVDGSSGASGWRPGVWTGMGLGALAAGAARTLFEQPRRDAGQAANWGGGRRRNFLENDDDDTPVFRRSAAAGPSRSGPSSSETRTSMGFGGTRNR
ncbi:hypothetical protein CBS101457_005792 [Exobasidium rhododendri]|nr:hypothetical protein CBS101457_005792 [Exobasidium rhododendri]